MRPPHAERVDAALGVLPIFRELAPPLRQRVAKLAALADLDKGVVLWNAGDAADTLTVVVSGRIKIVRHADAGDAILEIFGPGEPAGVVAVYNQIPYPATAIALEPTTVLRLPRRDWFDLLERDPGFTRAMLLAMTRLNLALTRKLAAMHGTRVPSRIATLFLSLAARMGRASREGVEIPLALSRQEIAESVGTTVETAIRVMSRWNREGLLLTERERFVIPDQDRLREAASVGDDE